MDKSISNFLIRHRKKDTVSFHMPGHKGSRIFEKLGYSRFISNMADLDITEIDGADNLFKPESIIRETMNKYKEIYGSRETYLLVNGSTGGLIASIMTCAARGEQVIMARNCHKSIFAGVEMAGAQPVYIKPELIENAGITGEVTKTEVAKAIKENPEAKVLILPSPNYYGICSDIEAISKLCHDRDIILIVDQAHGAHLKPFENYLKNGLLPKSAESQGADIVINSTHKTLCTFTQSAILNVVNPEIDLDVLEGNLQKMESSSPSYLLMCSLDVNADIILKHGNELFKTWMDNLTFFYEKVSKIDGISVVRNNMLDFSKINLDALPLGYDGYELEKHLTDAGIFPELTAGNLVMCMTGIGNDRSDFERLLDALGTLESRSKSKYTSDREIPTSKKFLEKGTLKPESYLGKGITKSVISLNKETAGGKTKSLADIMRLNPDKTDIPRHKKSVKLEDAAGKVCALPIVPYPPGIPVICPGEKFTREIVDYLIDLYGRGEKIIGISPEKKVSVGLDNSDD